MMKASSNCDRETCSLCSKYIYKHQPVVVCSMDGNIYHGKCLGTGFVQLVPGKFFHFMMIFRIYHM